MEDERVGRRHEGTLKRNEDVAVLSVPGKCCKQVEIPTEDELRALHAMRDIKNRVRELKKELTDLATSDRKADVEKVMGLQEEIVLLRTAWKCWEEKRKAAARERMISLGHEERDREET